MSYHAAALNLSMNCPPDIDNLLSHMRQKVLASRPAAVHPVEALPEPARGHSGRRDVPFVRALAVSKRWPCRTCCGQNGRAPVQRPNAFQKEMDAFHAHT